MGKCFTLILMFDYLILLIVSFLANAFSAFVGGGAGLLQLPILLFLGLSFSTALATHKIATIALGVGATLRHLRERRLSLNFSLLILGSGLPGVVLGANMILLLPHHLAILFLGILTIGLGFYSWFSAELGQQLNEKNRTTRGYVIGACVIFLIGFLNGSLTSGTGLFVTLWLIYWFGFDYKTAVAYTLVLVGLFWNGSGALTLVLQTEVRWDWLPVLLLASAVGGYVGAHLSIVKSNNLIKRSFELVTILVGLKLIISGLMAS